MVTLTKASRSYVLEVGGAMLAYGIVLVVSLTLLNAHPHAGWRVPVALAPLAPTVYAIWAYVRFLGRMDELQRRIQLDALALACGGTGLLTFSYGFLENVGLPPISLIWVFPLLMALWGLGGAVASWKYR
jgi:hypothetical protein